MVCFNDGHWELRMEEKSNEKFNKENPLLKITQLVIRFELKKWFC